MNPRFPIVAFALLALLAAGCGSSRGLDAVAPDDAFNQAMAEYQRGRFDRAADAFQHVFTFGRTHEYATDAQYYLAHSYYKSGQFLLAANEFTRFAEIYRADPRAEEAAFMRAMSYYELSPPFQLDQTDTETAITFFQLFLSQYPQSERVQVAADRMMELREKLAEKQFHTGRLYERRGLFQAAAISYNAVLERYPLSSFADDALLGVTRSYVAFANASVPARQAERFGRALESYERLIQLFPDSELIPQAEVLYGQALAGYRAAGGTGFGDTTAGR
jgi:outer membrane protein assembly factor BamD